MRLDQAFSLLVVSAFAGICAFALLGRRGEPNTSNSPSTTAEVHDAETLSLLLINSVAKKRFVDQVVSDFNARHLEISGKRLVVKVQHTTSGEGLSGIEEGSLQPDLWSPGDESWLRMANDRWRGLHSRSLFPKFDPTVRAPLCIAMWEPMAVALGYPKPLGWSDLARLSSDPRGWSAYGHPEWGAFKWGHAHPDANSGLLTLLAEIYALSQKTRDLTAEDLKAPGLLERLTALEHSVEHYGLSSVWIETFMREKGPAYLSATVQYENSIIEGNRSTQNKPFRVVAIYPKEGTLIAQHPIAIPDADWMSDERKAGARQFVDYLLSPQTQALAIQFGLRPALALPIAPPISTEWGVSPELPQIPNFAIPGEEVLQRIKEVWLATKKAASVLLLFDTSGSMVGEQLERAKAGAMAFIGNMQPRDELEIRTFSDRIVQLQPVSSIAIAGESARIKMRGLFASGSTHLYEVLRQGVVDWTERKRHDASRHFGIVVLTDGRDEGSPITLSDFLQVLPKGESPDAMKIFTIAYGTDADRRLLAEVANRSNARAFEGSVADIGRIYQELSANF